MALTMSGRGIGRVVVRRSTVPWMRVFHNMPHELRGVGLFHRAGGLPASGLE
ncbi:MAG TPA: hypothetical protein VKW09_06975 [bacterium]|nr:hypothetical protein [bacterium]